MKTNLLKFLYYLLGAFMLFGGIQHFSNHNFYKPIVPDFLVFESAIIYISGIVEIGLGIALFIPKTKKRAALGIFLLMIAFLPLHIWDVFRETPAMGSKMAAVIRLLVQFVIIFWTYKITEYVSNEPN